MTPTEAIEQLGLTMETKFIPFSQSRNKAEKSHSLNWIVTIKKGDKEIITTDYSAGCGHCPAYKERKGNENTIYNSNRIKTECEKGFAVRENSEYTINRNKPLLPKIEDIMYSLSMDSEAIECATYEEWASNFGYDPDSRKGESTYRQCLEIALKLRTSIGESGLTLLREAFQDY